MAITRKLVAKHMAHYDKLGEYIAADAIRRLLINGLDKREKAALKLVRARFTRTVDIQESLGIENNHAWVVMKNLNELGLVIKRYHKGHCEWLVRHDPMQEPEIE